MIFDYDGVLADTRQLILDSATHSATTVGVVCKPAPADLEALARMGFDMLGRQLGVPEADIDLFVQGCLAYLNAQDLPPEVIVGMGEVVAAAAALAPVGLLTGSARPGVERFLAYHGLKDYFCCVTTLEDPGSRAEKITRLAYEMGRPDGKIYMVGDAVSDIRAARSAGASSIAVAWGHQSRAKLSQNKPDFLVDTPVSLKCLLDRLLAA